jgi:hypothetical protein
MGIAPDPGMLWLWGSHGRIQGVKVHLVANGQGVSLGAGVGDGGVKLEICKPKFRNFGLGMGIASPTGIQGLWGCNRQIQGVKLHLLARGKDVP